jgi:uncharacterized membrane protein YqjE
MYAVLVAAGTVVVVVIFAIAIIATVTINRRIGVVILAATFNVYRIAAKASIAPVAVLHAIIVAGDATAKTASNRTIRATLKRVDSDNGVAAVNAIHAAIVAYAIG